MGTILYFSYGSNMLAQRLQERCKSARATGVAWADGYELTFHKISKDGSGKATLVYAATPAARVYGVLFKIDAAERDSLDRAEGDGYQRMDRFQVQTGDQDGPVEVTTYIARPSSCDGKLHPYDWYLNLVIKGAEQNRLPQQYVEGLKARKRLPDEVYERDTYVKARTLLQSLE